MKVFIVLAAMIAATSANLLTDAEIKPQWEDFKVKYGKTYASAVEEAQRMKIFKENVQSIIKHNQRFDKGFVTFKVGINHFADMHTFEVVEKMNGFRSDLVEKGEKVLHASNKTCTAKNRPWLWSKNVDWRSKGHVTPVKDQGQCGSCWAFSATGSLEGQLIKKTGQLVSLSEQNLVDCSAPVGDHGNEGCSGGLMANAFKYIKDNGGINTEDSYPYTAADGVCSYKATNKVVTLTGYVDINPTEEDLKDVVERIGPVSVAVDASNWSFHMYASGIYHETECSSDDVDHGVLVVGFGSERVNKDYWIVKNSWGTSWGEDGYIRMARNKNNNCGIASYASFAII